MPKILYKIVAVHDDEPPIEDPPEEWVQDGVNYPQGEPPPGVMSPTEVIPEMRPPNHVPPDPLPMPPPPEAVEPPPEPEPVYEEER